MNILEICKSSSAKTEFSFFFSIFFAGFRFFQYRRRCRFLKMLRYRFRFSVTDSALLWLDAWTQHVMLSFGIHSSIPMWDIFSIFRFSAYNHSAMRYVYIIMFFVTFIFQLFHTVTFKVNRTEWNTSI